MLRRLLILWLGTAALGISAWAAEELVRIDFRNRIPGVVDAPVFGFDNESGLESKFVAEILTGITADSLGPLAGTQQFLAGTDAGYLPYATPQERVIVPLSWLGQRIWFQIAIWERVPIGPFGEFVFVGGSEIYSMVITNDLMPLVGLESFSLVPDRLQITRQGDEAIMKWPYLAAQRYELQIATSLRLPVAWSPLFIFEWSGSAEIGQTFSVTNAMTNALQFYRLERWEFP